MFQHRLIIIVPVAKVSAVATWIQTNVDPTFPAGVGPGLSATGSAPATYNWASMGLVDGDSKVILFKLCQLAAITPPDAVTWQSWTFAQKVAWLQSVQSTIMTNYGAWVDLCDNTGVNWDSPPSVLTAMGQGLKVI